MVIRIGSFGETTGCQYQHTATVTQMTDTQKDITDINREVSG